MGYLIEGKWTDAEPPETGKSGEFRRLDSAFRHRITADGSSGFRAEAGRYHLYAGYFCPWAHRTLIFRVLKELEEAISVSYCLPFYRESGWTFEKRPGYPDSTEDEVNGFHYLYEAYVATDPRYTGKVTVPTLWDKKTKRIVNNESSEIIRMLNSAFVGIAGNGKDFYPEALRAEIDAINAFVYQSINNGVYRCGFARSQAAYDEAFDSLFAALDKIEARLESQRYLVGDRQTEADWRLFTTLVRFDIAYFPLFKCNQKRIADFPNLSGYTRDLYATPGIAATVKPRQYVQSYYSLLRLNPSGIIAKGTPVDFAAPHDRARLT